IPSRVVALRASPMRCSPSSRATAAPGKRLPLLRIRLIRAASPLVSHTTVTWPPARRTRWITPPQQSVSSSGCGEPTRSDVAASIGGRGDESTVESSVAAAPALQKSSALAATSAVNGVRARRIAAFSIARGSRFSLECQDARRCACRTRSSPVHTPPLAYHDPQSIDSDEGRPIRIVPEYLAPLRTFHDAGVTATVVFFGSARVRSDGPLGRYYDEACELARLVTAWSLEECHGRLIVCSR